jgi:glutamine synthetase
MHRSSFVRNALGSNAFENFLMIKRAEWEDYQMQVTRWETERYFSVL